MPAGINLAVSGQEARKTWRNYHGLVDHWLKLELQSFHATTPVAYMLAVSKLNAVACSPPHTLLVSFCIIPPCLYHLVYRPSLHLLSSFYPSGTFQADEV